MELPEPFFLKDETWYNYNVELNEYELTDKAPPKAVESFKEYYELLNKLAIPDELQ